MRIGVALLLASFSIPACSSTPAPPDACDGACTGLVDAPRDTALADSTADTEAADTGGHADATTGSDVFDAAPADAPAVDASRDLGGPDVGVDTGVDVGVETSAGDTGIAPVDAGHDTGTSTGGCVSGATGTHAVRFRWNGSGAGSTAYVNYLANDLPDTSRWMVSANSTTFGYTPVFDDIFLGAGGLDLESDDFMDVSISTAGLASITNVTLAIFGRSFDTTTNGSFSWQTFSGAGAAPTDLVSNVAPYQWYLTDATSSFVTGDSGVLLRIYPGPSSNTLIVNTVEICFDAL